MEKNTSCDCNVEQAMKQVLLAGFTRWVNDHPEETFCEAFENFLDFAQWEWDNS
jgi:phenolic acid decarboxylase